MTKNDYKISLESLGQEFVFDSKFNTSKHLHNFTVCHEDKDGVIHSLSFAINIEHTGNMFVKDEK